MRRDNRGRPRKLRHNPVQKLHKHIDDVKDAFIDHGLNIMDEVVERLLNQFFTVPGQIPPPASPPPPSQPPKSKRSAGTGPSPTTTQTLYDVLQVSPTSTTEVIDAAWKALCKRHHPDRGGDPELIKRINAAHDILSNPSHREKYDRLIGLKK